MIKCLEKSWRKYSNFLVAIAIAAVIEAIKNIVAVIEEVIENIKATVVPTTENVIPMGAAIIINAESIVAKGTKEAGT